MHICLTHVRLLWSEIWARHKLSQVMSGVKSVPNHTCGSIRCGDPGEIREERKVLSAIKLFSTAI